MTDVIRAPFEQRHIHRHFQGLTHDLDITIKQLVLQVFGAGGNDDFAARQQGGNEIGKGLAGSSPGFGHQHGVVADGSGHRRGHFNLAFAHTEAPHRLRQRTTGGKYVLEFLHHIRPRQSCRV